jgi:hypothetical protein
MTRLRALIVAATIAGPITLSLAALARDRVLWPFSQYPMYSRLSGPTTAFTRAVGVLADGREVPLPPQIEPAGLLLHVVVDHARRSPDATTRLSHIASAMGAEYERLRLAGAIDGPRLAAVRIYRETVQLATNPHVRSAGLLTEAPQP